MKITEWYKHCPKCGDIQYYYNKYKLKFSIEENKTCKKCMYASDEYKQKVATNHSIETKQKMRVAKLGKRMSEETKQKISSSLKTIGHKERLRKCMLKKMEVLGIPPNEDFGAKEWFEKYNKETNSSFQPKSFKEELGYIADGYDENKHIWIEYDTKYHKLGTRQAKDLIRQNNIIEHFKKIGKPLNGFWRILSYENNQIKIIV